MLKKEQYISVITHFYNIILQIYVYYKNEHKNIEVESFNFEILNSAKMLDFADFIPWCYFMKFLCDG